MASTGKSKNVDLVHSLSHKQRCDRFMDGYIRTNKIDLEIIHDIKIGLICNIFLDRMKFIRSNTEILAQKEREIGLVLSITFESKPMGIMVNPSPSYGHHHAIITKVSENNIHIKDGLRAFCISIQ